MTFQSIFNNIKENLKIAECVFGFITTRTEINKKLGKNYLLFIFYFIVPYVGTSLQT